MQENEITRRQLFVRSVATAAALSLSMSILAETRKAQARIDPVPDPVKDNELLNALLAAEFDAIATYSAGAMLIAADAVTPAATKKLVTDVAVHFQTQHKEHAAALSKLITDNKGTPVADTMTPSLPASFVASPKDTTAVMKLAADKEKAAAFTYTQVMAQISTSTAAKLVASIGAVETQHFVVLYLLIEGLIAATDKAAMSPSLVVPAAFILDVGAAGTLNLEKFAALDALLTLDPPPA